MERKIRNEKVRKWKARRARTLRSTSTSDRPRLTVYRSSKHIYAQLVDPTSGRTLCSVSSRSKALREAGARGNVDGAKQVGAAVAALAREKQIEEVVFNRNGFLYHGMVKALADAAREAGLKF